MKQASNKWLYIVLSILDYIIAFVFLILMVIFRLFALPYGLLKSVMTVEIANDENSSEVKMITILREWVGNHQNDLADASETFGDKENYFIKIVPKHNNAATLNIEIGFPRYLRVSIDNFGIEFSDDELDASEELMNKLLLSYENGKYLIKKWFYNGAVIDSCFIMELEDKKQYSSKTDGFKLLRKLFAKVKIKRFLPIAAIE
ncbi:MAG: hypothetical protein AB7I18_15125 [Candidatus Berkiella sp.]